MSPETSEARKLVDVTVVIPNEEGSGAPIARDLVNPSPTTAPAPTSGREDYDAAISFSGMAPGEPYFLLKGHDQAAADTVRAYAAAIEQLGADDAMVESALQLADRMAAYPDKRLVDADHLAEDEVLQLRYQLRRRAQRAMGDVAADTSLMLAEIRAEQVVVSRLRPTLRNLFAGLSQDGLGRWIFDATCLARGDAREGLKPSPCPIEELHRFYVSMGREPPPETLESQLIRAKSILGQLIELKRMKAQEGATIEYQRRQPRVWAEAQAVLNSLGGRVG